MNNLDLNALTNYFKYISVKENIFTIKDIKIVV